MMEGVSPKKTAPVSREEKKAQTRARLLDAAATVFARKGFAGASLDDVADEAGLTKGAVYSNFTSKENLIEELLEERLSQDMNEIGEITDRRAAPGREPEIAGALLMSALDRNREFYLLDFEYQLYLARHPELVKRNSERFERNVALMADIMQRRADAEGRTLPMPAKDLTKAMFALGAGIDLQRLVDPDRIPDDLFTRMLMVLFGQPVDAAGENR